MYDNMEIGMKDCSGKEICCGDVYVNRFGDRYCVYFVNGAFCGGISPEKCIPIGWVIEDGEMVEDNWTHNIEVIGNINDTPELMNDE
jgi:hypothetical protein